jgi:hypothetical protein
MMLGATTFWTYTWSTQEAPTPEARFVPRSYNPLVSGATTLWLVFEARSYNFLDPLVSTHWDSNPNGSFSYPWGYNPKTCFWGLSYNFLNPLISTHWGSNPKACSLHVGYNPSTCFWCHELQPSGLTLVPPIKALTLRARSSYMTSLC